MISQQQIDIIIKVMEPYKPKKIGIFGSYARGENSKESDIDILYEFDFDTKFTLFDQVRLHEDLENSLKVKVDLVSENGLHPLMKQYVMNDLVLIYENGKEYHSFEAHS